MPKENEKLVPVLEESVEVFHRNLTPKAMSFDSPVERTNRSPVLVKKKCFGAKPVDGFNHWLKSNCELLSEPLQVLVKWFPQQVRIHISQQMNEAFLLRTRD
jgi:hypothetical protein